MSNKNVRVAVVDDDKGIRLVLKVMLQSLGYEVSLFESGLEFLNVLQTGVQWDLILVDFMMPEMDGLEMLRSARVVNPYLPIVMLSAIDRTELVAKFMQDGGSWFLTKPILSNELFGVQIRHVLEHAEAQAELRRIQSENAVKEAAQQMEKDFILNMSNELSAPIKAMISFTQFVGENIGGIDFQLRSVRDAIADLPGNEEAMKILANLLADKASQDISDEQKWCVFLDDIQQLKIAADYIQYRAKEMLDLSPFERKKANADEAPTDFVAALRGVITNYQKLAADSGVTLMLQADEEILTCFDRAVIERTVGILIANALRSAACGGAVTVKCWSLEGAQYISFLNDENIDGADALIFGFSPNSLAIEDSDRE